jgi:hypothetical protein
MISPYKAYKQSVGILIKDLHQKVNCFEAGKRLSVHWRMEKDSRSGPVTQTF